MKPVTVTVTVDATHPESGYSINHFAKASETLTKSYDTTAEFLKDVARLQTQVMQEFADSTIIYGAHDARKSENNKTFAPPALSDD